MKNGQCPWYVSAEQEMCPKIRGVFSTISAANKTLEDLEQSGLSARIVQLPVPNLDDDSKADSQAATNCFFVEQTPRREEAFEKYFKKQPDDLISLLSQSDLGTIKSFSCAKD